MTPAGENAVFNWPQISWLSMQKLDGLSSEQFVEADVVSKRDMLHGSAICDSERISKMPSWEDIRNGNFSKSLLITRTKNLQANLIDNGCFQKGNLNKQEVFTHFAGDNKLFDFNFTNSDSFKSEKIVFANDANGKISPPDTILWKQESCKLSGCQFLNGQKFDDILAMTEKNLKDVDDFAKTKLNDTGKQKLSAYFNSTGDFDAAKFIFERYRNTFLSFDAMIDLINKSPGPYGKLSQYGEATKPDFFEEVFRQMQTKHKLGDAYESCESGFKQTLGITELTGGLRSVCSGWPYYRKIDGRDYPLWQSVKASSCGIISFYFLEVAAKKRQHSVESYVEYYVDMLKNKLATSSAALAGPSLGDLLFCRQMEGFCKDKEVNFKDGDLAKYKRFLFYAGNGNFYKSEMHWSPFLKNNNIEGSFKYVLYDFNPNDEHRPCKSDCKSFPYGSEGVILNKKNMNDLWNYHAAQVNEFGEKTLKKEAWIYLLGIKD